METSSLGMREGILENTGLRMTVQGQAGSAAQPCKAPPPFPNTLYTRMPRRTLIWLEMRWAGLVDGKHFIRRNPQTTSSLQSSTMSPAGLA